MNSFSGSLQDSVNLLFPLIVYLPVNLFFMIVTAILFRLVNNILHLNFPAWILATAAALLVFIIMASFLNGSYNQGSLGSSVDLDLFYSVTLVINGIVVALMLTVAGISKIIFADQAVTDFTFQKPQIIVSIVYLIAIFICSLPILINDLNGYTADIGRDKQLTLLKESIDANNVDDVLKAYIDDENSLDTYLPGDNSSFIDYLIATNKKDIISALLKHDKQFYQNAYGRDISDPAMLELFINNGLDPVRAIESLTAYNHDNLAKIIVDKYHPNFTFLVSEITANVIRHNDINLLDYLVKNGLYTNTKQTQDAIDRLVETNKTIGVQLLIDRGIKIDTSNKRLTHFAIQNKNLPLLKILFQYPFRIEIYDGFYTDLENAIVNNDDKIFDFLLAQKPNVTTFHRVGTEEQINAIILAEKYERIEMLTKLKQYVENNTQ